MTVYRRGGVWWMNFSYRGARVQRSTGQVEREAAEAVERRARDQLRQAAHGVRIETPIDTPRFQDWAEIYLDDVERRAERGQIGDVDRINDLLRGVLRFFGAMPVDDAKRVAGAPYHNLRLGDVVDDPSWLLKWEAWLRQPKPERRGRKDSGKMRTWSGQTKNQHRSTLSQLYVLATKPAWRAQTGITSNPCAAVDRDRARRRTATLSAEDLQAILSHASYHLRLAIAIGVYCPKLREGNILRLRWSDFSPTREWLKVDQHKTARATGRPLVAYVPAPLREILAAAATRRPHKTHVISLRGKPIKEMRGAMRGAVERAARARPHLRYGLEVEDGVTFHTLRHSAATMLAELAIPPEVRQGVMGHKHLATTMWYTHLRPLHQMAPAEQLAAAVPLKDLVLVKWKRPPRVAPTVTDTPAHSRDSREIPPGATSTREGASREATDGGSKT